MQKPQGWFVVLAVAVLIAGLAASAGAAPTENTSANENAQTQDRGDGERPHRPKPVRPGPTPPPPAPPTDPPPTPDPDPSPGSFGTSKFDILVTGGDNPATREWWVAPYIRDLHAVGISQVPGVGWTDGDRAGYRCAYMFLYQNGDENDIIGRVTFTRVAGYAQINDQYMAEFVRAYDGGLDYTSQAECPGPTTVYEEWDGADYRPKIFYVENGQLLENRSYTNTSSDAIAAGALKFREFERITTPFTDTGGISTCDDYCTVYERVTVLAYFDDGNGFFPAVAVYYDSLSPNVSIAQAGPGGFEPSQPTRTGGDTSGSQEPPRRIDPRTGPR